MIIMGWALHGHLAFAWGQTVVTSEWFSGHHRAVLLLPFARANCYPLHCQLSIAKQSCCVGPPYQLINAATARGRQSEFKVAYKRYFNGHLLLIAI
jgi:hypothetical protein